MQGAAGFFLYPFNCKFTKESSFLYPFNCKFTGESSGEFILKIG